MKFMRDLLSGLAVAIAALGLQWALTQWTGTRLPFMVIEPAIIFVAAALGRWPATVVMLVGAANAAVALAPSGQSIASDPASRWAIFAYGVIGVLLIAYGGRLHLRDSRAERAEQRLTLAQDETGVGLFELDYQADTAYASPALCQILGQPVMDGSMPLQQWLSALNAGHVADSRRSMQQKVAAGELRYERELRVELPDGQAHWLLSRIRLDLDSRGELAAARGATLDITARKQLLTELELAQAQLRRQLDDLSRLHSLGNQLLAMPFLDAALHAMLDAVCTCHETTFGMLKLLDAEGGMRVAAHCGLADDAAVELAEATEEAICRRVAMSGERIVVADIEADPALTALHRVARTLGVHALHTTPLLASGGGAVLGVFTVLTTAPGQPSERLLRLTDLFAGQAAALIERDKAVSLARETQQRFEVALQSSPVPFTILAPVHDAGGQIVDFSWIYANPAAGGLIDRPAQDLIGRRIIDVLPHAWNEPGMIERYTQVSEQGLTFEFETLTQRPDRQRWLQVVASPLNGSVVVWFSDVTQRREEQLALREADRRKDEFLATLAHELRNPLAPIRHAVAIVRDPAASEAQHQWGLAVIDRQLQHMALLLDDLLDVARITRGTLPLRRVRCALQPVVAAAVETAMPLLNERRHRLVVDLADAPMWLDADALRIGQVLGNLLANAAKYTDPGGEVRLSARLEGDEGNDVVITVTDTGRGLRAEDCERVFEMFTQLSTDDDGPQQGLGIGLALSSRLVQLHGGRLDAASPGLGGGCTFTVRLPAAPVMGDEAPAPLDTSGRVPTGGTCRILVADDNRDAADSLALLLGLDGHDVQVAYDGSDALARYRSFRPQIALLDMSMPALSGEELARLIRAEQQAPITLVAITGFGQQQDRERAVDAGFDQHLVKPIQHEQLQAIIDALKAAPQDLPA